MKVVLHPFSAICYWLTVEALPAVSVRLDGRHAKGFTPSRGVADYLRAVCPALSFPVHVLVGSGRRTARADFCFHRFPVAWQKVVFYPVASGVYVPSPAATLVGIAPLLGFEDLCFLANTLCGCFRLDPVSPSGLASREPSASCWRTTPELEVVVVAQGCSPLFRAEPIPRPRYL